MDVLCTASVGLVGDVGDNKTLFREDAQLTCDACLSRTLLIRLVSDSAALTLFAHVLATFVDYYG